MDANMKMGQEAVTMRKQLTTLIGLIGVFIVVVSLFIYEWVQPAFQYPEAREGQLDARQWNFAKQGILPLRGEWEFYENKLLTPQDFRENEPQIEAERRLIQVPGSWKDYAGGYGAGTYRLRIQVSEPDLYSLRGKKIRMSSHIYMGESDLGGTGQPALSADRFVPSNLPFFGTMKADTGIIDVLIQVASYRYVEGGLVQAPEFGLTADVSARRDNARLADMIVITVMLVFGVYFAGMFRQWRKEPYLVYFSMFCFVSGLFLSSDNEILMATLFPSISFLLLQRLIFILPYCSILFFGLYVYRYLNKSENRGIKWLCWCSCLYLILLVATPNEYLVNTRGLGLVLQIVVFAFIFFWIFRHRHRGVQVYSILMGVFFLIISWAYAQTRYQLALDNPYYMIVTPLLLILSQSFLMSDRFREAYLRSEKLAGQLIEYDRQKDEFLIRTSHEFKTPLHGMINMAQVVIEQSGEELAMRQRDNMGFIIAQANRLSTLVNDIIDFQSLQRGSLMIHNRLFDVSGTVQATIEALKYLRRNDQVQLVNQVWPGTFYLFTDENRLKQIFVNLIGNSLKYTERGNVTVAAESREGWLHLTFADTGSGMSEERRRHLFTDEPFDSGGELTDYPSSGLGLKIAKALAVQMGGDLELQWTEQERGSLFELRLPEAAVGSGERGIGQVEAAVGLERSLPETGSATPKFQTPRTGGVERPDAEKILLVDDDASNIKVLEELFASSRYQILVAYNGTDALELIETHRDLSLVLLDVMMPGISGYEVCRRIRAQYPLYKLPVLLLTVRHSAADVAAGLEAGANDFLTKPFEGKELMARVHTLLQLKEAVEQAVQMETLFLQSQIKPHFIYNALSGIMSLCYSDGKRAGKLLGEFSNYLRLSFDLDPHYAKVSLNRELSHVKSYVALEKARFGERLRVEWNTEASKEMLIPALIIQPLVENAIRHGLMKRISGGTVVIQTIPEQHGLRIVVEDDGIGISEEQLGTILSPDRSGGSIGLINVHKRLLNEYGQGLQIESIQGKGTKVIILIPSLTQSDRTIGSGG